MFRTETLEALKQGPTVDVANVRVHAENGVVTLEGTALNAKEVRAMHNIVENLPGVKQVINSLHLADGTKFWKPSSGNQALVAPDRFRIYRHRDPGT